MTVAVVDASARSLFALGQAARKLTMVKVVACGRDQLQDEAGIAAFAADVRKSDAIILIPHGSNRSIPGLDVVLKAATGKLIHIQPVSSSDAGMMLSKQHSTGYDTAAYRLRHAYIRRGGADNWQALLQAIAREIGLAAPAPEAPKDLPTEGIYHPDYTGKDDSEAYLAWARQRQGKAAPVVGVWFYHSHWACGDLAIYDALIAEIEAKGAIPFAVFHMRMGEDDLTHLPVAQVVDRYFMDDEGSRIDVLLSPMSFSLARMNADAAAQSVLEKLDVPVLQLILTAGTRAEWEQKVQALPPVTVSMSVVQPEFDGVIVGTVVATRETMGRDPVTGASLTQRVPIPDRVRHVVGLALNWARLRRIPPADRKVAILFHHYPPKNANLGCAYGLDSFASVKAILDRMMDEGYTLESGYADGNALAQDLLGRLTNDRRFLPPQEMARRAIAYIPSETVCTWHNEQPDHIQAGMEAKWGAPPGKTFCFDDQLLVGGITNGNIFIGMQPPRQRMEEEDKPVQLPDGSAIHDPDLPPTYHYMHFYRWLRDDFGAHAVIHVGMHGSLEWLPGKAVGLSAQCYPEAVLSDMPNIYPYIVNNPGEGMQAKRRSSAVILDHMVPAQTSAGKTEVLEDIEELLEKAYFAGQEDPGKLPILIADLWEKTVAAHLDADLGLDRQAVDQDPHAFMQSLHGYLTEIETSTVSNGLHIFGQPPSGDDLNETMLHMTRLSAGDRPSLWDAVALSRGLDCEDLRDDPGTYLPHLGKTKGQMLSQFAEDILAAFSALDAAGWSDDHISVVVDERFSGSALVRQNLSFVAQVLRPKLLQTRDEMDHAMRSLSGRFVPPGPSGAPTRGDIDALPTGRNFFSVDPLKIPSPEAWKVGVMQGDALVDRYLKDEGRYPENIGMVLWAGPTMRTRGDDVAQILYLMGVRPIWSQANGRVRGVEPIPLNELKFPRLDVTVRGSGLLRDAFPNIMSLIDQAVCMVAALAEPAEANLLARNVKVDIADLLAAGVSMADAQRRSTLRVFSNKPGCYGAGVNQLLDKGDWTTADDIAKVYLQWGGYAYGEGVDGQACQDDLRRRLGKLQVTLKTQDNREFDIFSGDDANAYQGGMNAAIRALSGQEARSYSGDSSDPRRPRVRSTAEEGRFLFRTRVLNPKWIGGMKRHGFKGAGDLAKVVAHCCQWDATSHILEDWQYAEIAQVYALDPEMQDFFRANNPHALHSISELLLEAVARGLWQSPGALQPELEAVLLDSEGEIEDSLNEISPL